ncbi:MAG TPA: hypothetical protein VFW24_02395, partial [Acidimicrobiales bacterium]|nr:hypothetical protein [Acidimicrobiales bacterium]
MRLATVRTPDGTRAARIDGSTAFLLPFAGVGDLLASGPDWADRAVGGTAAGSVAELDLAPVVPA